jgi:lipoprotein-releasing system permease protein
MSRLPFELLLALRYLRPKRTFVSIITLISVMGVMLGVAVLLIVISVMSGFDHDLREKVLGFNSHVKISMFEPSTGDLKPLANYAYISSVVAKNPDVTGVAPVVFGPVLIETNPREGEPERSATPILRGADPKLESSVSKLPQSVVEGKFDLSGHGLVLGLGVARSLRIHIGDRVSVYSPDQLRRMKAAHDHGKDLVIPPSEYEVRGIFDTGYHEFNASLVVASLENAQELNNLYDNDSVHGLLVAIKDPLQAASVAHTLNESLGQELTVTTWMEESDVMAAVMVEKNMMLYILFFIVLVAAFGITCTLVTFIMMKTREIGLMKALGASSRQIMWVFLSQSLIVSVMGILAGMALGLTAVAYRNEFLHLMRRLTGFELFPAKIYQFYQIPALVTASDLAVICGGSLVICLLAAVFPAWHASKLNPVEALRHE